MFYLEALKISKADRIIVSRRCPYPNTQKLTTLRDLRWDSVLQDPGGPSEITKVLPPKRGQRVGGREASHERRDEATFRIQKGKEREPPPAPPPQHPKEWQFCWHPILALKDLGPQTSRALLAMDLCCSSHKVVSSRTCYCNSKKLTQLSKNGTAVWGKQVIGKAGKKKFLLSKGNAAWRNHLPTTFQRAHVSVTRQTRGRKEHWGFKLSNITHPFPPSSAPPFVASW